MERYKVTFGAFPDSLTTALPATSWQGAVWGAEQRMLTVVGVNPEWIRRCIRNGWVTVLRLQGAPATWVVVPYSYTQLLEL